MTSLTYIADAVMPPPRQVLTVVAYFLALSLGTGLTLSLAYLMPAAARGAGLDRRLRSFAVPLAVFTVVAGYLQYVARIAKSDLGYSWAQSLAPTHVLEFLRLPREENTWASAGIMGTTQLLLFVALAATLVRIGSSTGRAPAIAGFWIAIVAAACPSLTVATLDLDRLAGRLLKMVHILAADIWIGGVLILAAAALPALRSSRTDSGLDPATSGAADPAGTWDRVWSRFSVWAMGAVVAVTLSGLWLTWVHLGSLDQFVTTPYGRFLLIKLLLVAFMVGAGAYNAVVLIPGLRRARLSGDIRGYTGIAMVRFPRTVVAESAAAVAILVIVPFLAGSARKQAGGPAAGPFDWGTFGYGSALLVLLAASMITTVRSLHRRDARPAGSTA